MARILVTGGMGLIGRHAVTALASAGHDLHLITRKSPSSDHPGASLHQADLMDSHALDDIFAQIQPNILLHMAWETEHGKFWNSSNNLDYLSASLNLARKFRENGGQRFVGVGSCAEYDWSPENTAGPLDELTSVAAPHTLYGQSKLSCFELLRRFFSSGDTSFVWGRLFLLYGEGEYSKRLCPDVIGNLLQDKPVNCSSGTQIRDFMDTRDAGEAFAHLCLSDIEGPVNVATGTPTRLADFVGTIAEKIGKPDLIRLGALPDRPDDPAKLIPNTDRLHKEAGYKSNYDLASSLQHTIDWWRRKLAE